MYFLERVSDQLKSLAGFAVVAKLTAILAAIRNTQLDGWRAFAVLGVIWLHWAPKEWRGPFPFEIGLFFFLTLTGFLITRILLREKKLCENLECEGASRGWRGKAYIAFQKRRMLRILLPCYVAMIFAIMVGAPDISAHPWIYAGHLSNFHMAYMERWPSGTAHYWTLALQIQFYLFWPILVFWVPQKSLVYVFGAIVALAPLGRMMMENYSPQIYHSEALPFVSCDYFAVGAILALAMERGMAAGNFRLKWLALAALGGYTILYVFNERGQKISGLCFIQQTLVAIAFAGLISATLAGFSGILGRVLDHPFVQEIGRLSFGLYLFHTLVPLFLGWIMPFLWHPFFSGPWVILRLIAFALTSWGFAILCLKYLEGRSQLPKQQKI